MLVVTVPWWGLNCIKPSEAVGEFDTIKVFPVIVSDVRPLFTFLSREEGDRVMFLYSCQKELVKE